MSVCACVSECAPRVSVSVVCGRGMVEHGVGWGGRGGCGGGGGERRGGAAGHACAVTVTGIYNRSDVRATAIPFHTLLGLPPVLTGLGAKQWTPTD